MVDSEEAGQWAGRVTLGPWQQEVTTWTILITFTQPLDWLDRCRHNTALLLVS